MMFLNRYLEDVAEASVLDPSMGEYINYSYSFMIFFRWRVLPCILTSIYALCQACEEVWQKPLFLIRVCRSKSSTPSRRQ